MRTLLNSLLSVISVPLLIAPAVLSAPVLARDGIAAGNQSWIDGVKSGNVTAIAATYAEAAVDCDATGQCIQGRSQIERRMASELGKLGKARSASVKTWGSTQHGNFVYEWGQAEAIFESKRLVEPYLTVWQKQLDGSWKIFRNLVIPKS